MTTLMQQQENSFTVERLVHYRSRQFQEVMRIYQREFPADSRLSVATIRTLLKGEQYQLFVTREGETMLGFALVWISRRPAFVHLDYIAVRQERKGRGIGTALYRWLTTHLPELCPRASLLTLEVGEELIPFYRRSDTHILNQTTEDWHSSTLFEMAAFLSELHSRYSGEAIKVTNFVTSPFFPSESDFTGCHRSVPMSCGLI